MAALSVVNFNSGMKVRQLRRRPASATALRRPELADVFYAEGVGSLDELVEQDVDYGVLE